MWQAEDLPSRSLAGFAMIGNYLMGSFASVQNMGVNFLEDLPLVPMQK